MNARDEIDLASLVKQFKGKGDKMNVIKCPYKLSATQAKHKKSIKWLLSSFPRAEGRSTLMAICYIELAIEEGMEIKVVDHHGRQESCRHTMRLIKDILNSSGLLSKYQWRIGEEYIHCIKSDKFDDHLSEADYQTWMKT